MHGINDMEYCTLPGCQRCLPEHCPSGISPWHAKVLHSKWVHWYDFRQDVQKRNNNHLWWLQIWTHPSRQWTRLGLQSSHVWLPVFQCISNRRVDREERWTGDKLHRWCILYNISQNPRRSWENEDPIPMTWRTSYLGIDPSRRKRHIKHPLTKIQINNEHKLMTTTSHKFLGVILDDELWFQKHAAYPLSKGKQWISQIKRLSKVTKGMHGAQP